MPNEAQSGLPGRAVGRVLEWLFPARCNGCDCFLVAAPNPWFCVDCWGEIGVDDGVVCDCCGIAIPADLAGGVPGWRCGECVTSPPAFHMARVMGRYDGHLGAALRQLKYQGRTGIAPALVGKVALEQLPPPLREVDLVVPVPLHPARLRSRGFNQSARLARALADRLGKAVLVDGLTRIGRATSQVGLNRAQRIKNVRGAFAVTDAGPVADKRILLVDDVMTTGATAQACARVLEKAGARQVVVWAVARQGLD